MIVAILERGPGGEVIRMILLQNYKEDCCRLLLTFYIVFDIITVAPRKGKPGESQRRKVMGLRLLNGVRLPDVLKGQSAAKVVVRKVMGLTESELKPS